MEQVYGHTGKILRVNLSRGEFGIETEAPATLRKYLGGVGLGANILYHEVPPGAGWSDPENRIILASGPLGGTKVMGSGNFSVVTRGALTDGPTSTQANGYFGAYIKFAGFDAVIVQGKAPELCYIYIHDGQAELRDAGHLAGKDTWETEDLIKEELGFSSQAMSVFGIGPAGENLVRFAALVGDRGHVAAHNGPGAVMGSKNLKAIAVARGKGRVRVYDAAKLSSLSKQMFEVIKNDAGWAQTYHYGTLWIMGALVAAGGPGPFGLGGIYKNYRTTVSPMSEEEAKTFSPDFLRERLTVVRRHPCWGCQMHHCDIIRIPEGPYAGAEGEEPEYEGYAAVGTQIGIWDGITATALCNEVDRLGLDINETGWVLGMVMECYEKGLLTRADTDGLEMTWGNVEAVRAMINKIAHRQGVGNMLAEGVMRAAQSIGGEATDFAVHSQSGNTPVSHDHRTAWAYLLDMCVSNTGTSEVHLMPRTNFLGFSSPGDPYSHREIASMVAEVKGFTPFMDSLGVCRQSNRDVPELLVGMLNAGTGWDFTFEEGMQVGLRVVNLLRAFNIRRGYKPEVEAPSPRYGSIVPDGPARGKDIAPVLDEMLDIYYREMGWDRATGKPLPETLQKLDLADIIPDLWPPKS